MNRFDTAQIFMALGITAACSFITPASAEASPDCHS